MSAKAKVWNAEKDAELAQMTCAEFAASHPGHSVNSARCRKRMLGLPIDTVVLGMRGMTGSDNPSPPIQPDIPEPDPDDLEYLAALLKDLDDMDNDDKVLSIFTLAQRISDVQESLSPSTHSVEHQMPDDGLPIAVAFTGDWHLGGGGVDTDRLKQDIATIATTDGLQAIGMGDFVDGVSIHSKAVSALYDASAIGSRGLQNTAALAIARQAKGKWLAIIEGNHDAWSEKHASINCTRDFAKHLGSAYFHQGGGSVYVTVGGVRYNIAVRHNAPGNSRLNTTNSQRRMFDDWPEWANCDVICLAHFHFNDLHHASRKGGQCVYLRSGTYKLRDSYAANGGFTPEWGIPVAILYPDERRVHAFRGDQFHVALRFLANEREYYRGLAA